MTFTFPNWKISDVEDILFWSVFDAEKELGKDRVRKGLDFTLDKETKVLDVPWSNLNGLFCGIVARKMHDDR